jgi:nucleotide-binding universal stress UspA family protein
VVVGAHGMSAATKWVFGSTTDRVLRQAPMSVFVIPSEWRPLHPEANDLCGLGPVIAAVDFSEAGVGAAYAAARFARFLNTGLTVLHVVPQLRVIERWSTHGERALAESTRTVRAELEAALSRVSAIAPMDLRVVTGDIVGSILHAAEPTGSCTPLLVLGRRPHVADRGGPGIVVSRALASLQVPMLVIDSAEGVCPA